MTEPSKALPREAYDDPADVVAAAQTGDQVPRSPAPLSRTCADCEHHHAPTLLHRWPCELGNEASRRTGRCRCWRVRR